MLLLRLKIETIAIFSSIDLYGSYLIIEYLKSLISILLANFIGFTERQYIPVSDLS